MLKLEYYVPVRYGRNNTKLRDQFYERLVCLPTSQRKNTYRTIQQTVLITREGSSLVSVPMSENRLIVNIVDKTQERFISCMYLGLIIVISAIEDDATIIIFPACSLRQFHYFGFRRMKQ